MNRGYSLWNLLVCSQLALVLLYTALRVNISIHANRRRRLVPLPPLPPFSAFFLGCSFLWAPVPSPRVELFFLGRILRAHCFFLSSGDRLRPTGTRGALRFWCCCVTRFSSGSCVRCCRLWAAMPSVLPIVTAPTATAAPTGEQWAPGACEVDRASPAPHLRSHSHTGPPPAQFRSSSCPAAC